MTSLQSNAGEHLSNETMFAVAHRRFHEFIPPLRLIESLSFGSKRRAQGRMSSPRGLLTVFQTHFQSVVSNRQYRNEKLLNLQRTKEYIPHIPRGQAALHTGNTSLLYPHELTANIILMSFYQISKMHSCWSNSNKEAWRLGQTFYSN